MKFKLKLHKLPKAKKKPCFDFSQMEEYQVELKNRFELLDIPEAADPGNRQSAESEWVQLKEVVAETAAKTLTRKTTMVNKEWIKPETFALMEEKRNCRRRGDEYKKLKRQVRSLLRRDRADHLTDICQQMNDYEKRNKSKDLLSKVTELTKKVYPAVKVISIRDGQTLTETEHILEIARVLRNLVHRSR